MNAKKWEKWKNFSGRCNLMNKGRRVLQRQSGLSRRFPVNQRRTKAREKKSRLYPVSRESEKLGSVADFLVKFSELNVES